LVFFKKQYILEDTIPKLAPKVKDYSIDIVDVHGLSEAILTFNQSIKYIPENKILLKSVLSWGIRNMQTKKGWFIFRWVRENSKINKVEFPFMRWGQAWMMFALTEIKLNENNHGL